MKLLLVITSLASTIVGIAMILGGLWGIVYTYESIARENIITPDDAPIPNTPVRGPLTLKAQADTIRKHTLEMAGGKTYAELPRMVEMLDEEGNTVLNDDGEPVMVPNETRATWITATTLMTALKLGIMAYTFSALVAIIGLLFLWHGYLFRKIRDSINPHSIRR